MKPTGRQTWIGLSKVTARVFRERQILVRSDDSVRGLTLSPRLQKLATTGVVALALVYFATGGAVLWQEHRVAQREAELADLAAKRDQLRLQVERLHAMAERLAGQESQAVGDVEVTPRDLGRLQAAIEDLAARRDRVAAELDRNRRALTEAERRAERLASVREELRSELARTRSALSSASSGKEDLGGKLADTMADLRAARASRQAAIQGRLRAQRRAEVLEDELNEVRAEEDKLLGRLDSLQARLRESERQRGALVAERRELADKVGHLEATLGQMAQRRGQDLVDRIAGLQKALVAAESERDRLAEDRNELRDRVVDLRGRVDTMRERQFGLIEHFTARTRDGLDTIEKTVEMTGLDVDNLIARVQRERQARGGPFVPVAVDAPFVKGVAKLDRQMQRLLTLQAALGSLPLTAPLDAYWISSYFGKRRDPYNDRWAMHEGLDLAAQANSVVQAAAPGKVVFAGWKKGYGRVVEIDHGYGITTLYGHLKSTAVKKGQQIGHRERIGRVGSTGRSTGPHVHYEIRVDDDPVDPMNFLKAGKHVFKG